MCPVRFGTLLFTIALLLNSSAGAEPITVSVQGFDGVEDFSATDTLPDNPSNDNFLGLADRVGFNPSRLSTVENGKSVEGPLSNTVDSDFAIRLTFSRAGVQIPGEKQPYIDITGHVSGGFSAGGSEDISGGTEGLAKTAMLSNWSPDSAIPRTVLDTFLDPSRIRLGASVGGGGRNEYFSFLMIDPSSPAAPAPVPEPTSLVAFATVIVGIASVRRWGRNS